MLDTRRRTTALRSSPLLAIIAAPSYAGEFYRPALCRLGGKTLLTRSLECAMESRAVCEIVVITNDHDTALAAGRLCRGKKPVRLAHIEGEFTAPRFLGQACEHSDLTGKHIAVLSVSSPLLAPGDIDAAAAIFEEHLALQDERRPLSLLSVGEFFGPASLARMRWIVRDRKVDSRLTRMRASQGCICSTGEEPALPNAELATLNSALMMLTRPALAQWLAHPEQGMPAERLAYIMPEERSLQIESERELRIAETVIGARNYTTVVAPPLSIAI